MPFIVIFNIVICVIMGIDLVFLLISKYIFAPKKLEDGTISTEVADKAKLYGYIIFFAIITLLLLINLIF